MVERDLAEVVLAMTSEELRDKRRDLAVGTGLMRRGSPMYRPAVTYLSAVETELARRGEPIVTEQLNGDMLSSDGHNITPALGTMRQVSSGQPGTCLNPSHYPLIAVCLECGKPIKIDCYSITAEWYHLERLAS